MGTHLHAKGMLVALAASLLFPAVAAAKHCEEIRCSYDDRIERLEVTYRHERQTMYAAYECERERLNELLCDARRHAAHHRHAIADVKSLKQELREAHRCVHESMNELECAFNAQRRELVAERNAAMRACRTGSCRACGSVSARERPRVVHRYGSPYGPLELTPPRTAPFERSHGTTGFGYPAVPGPRYLPGDGPPPLPTPDGANWNGHPSGHRNQPRTVNWIDMVSLLLSR